MHDDQNIQNYGGLRKYMPQTFITFIIAALAISGIPPLSGFFSKDDILWYAFTNGNIVYWLIGTVTALLTAFYMFRLVYLTFYGDDRFGREKHPHESPKIMTIPLIILAVLSAIGGFIGIPEIFSGEHGNLFENWLEPIFSDANAKLAVFGVQSHSTEFLLMSATVIGVVGSILYARYLYLQNTGLPSIYSKKFKGLYNILLNKYFVDEFYDAAIVNPTVRVSDKILWKINDNKIIDGVVNGTASLIELISRNIRKLENGIAQVYAVMMVLGIVAALFWLILSL
jgi:NADH-quinone oxidoreductase subunit L